MTKTKELVNKIIEGIQEKKGTEIVVADLTEIGDTICDYLVICQGNSPTQLDAIIRSIAEVTERDLNERPIGLDGYRNAEWVAMDYVDVVVHVFLPDFRAFYQLENLWADAKLDRIPNLD
ncbi:MAG: ribosome silencing factor [Bacteroidaceae bacterium]|nr:ribosome silencing factor [Bacteroidaceae bacterium]